MPRIRLEWPLRNLTNLLTFVKYSLSAPPPPPTDTLQALLKYSRPAVMMHM